MSTKIGLISDPHASPLPVAEAMAIFQREKVATILCAGDIGGYGEQLDETVQLLSENNVESVCGNHEVWALQQPEFPGSELSRDYFSALSDHRTFVSEGLSLYMVHAEPPNKLLKGLRLFDQHGKVRPEVMAEWDERLQGFHYDVLILGHTHQVFDVTLGNVLVINPGSSAFNHSCAILTLPEKTVSWFALSGKSIQPIWSWGVSMIR